MNYPTYMPYGSAYPAGFGPQSRAGAFSSQGYPVPPAAQNAQPPQNFGQGSGFLIQPVTTRQEALAVIADPFASGVLMPDMGHGVIYLKRFNPQTGASDFAEFRPVAETPPPAEPQYVSVEMFEKTVENLRAEIGTAKPVRKGAKQDAADE